jgi:hypothetical protein
MHARNQESVVWESETYVSTALPLSRYLFNTYRYTAEKRENDDDWGIQKHRDKCARC